MADRTVLVTGATGGIGKATAVGLAVMGAHLAITGRDRGRTEAAAREIRTGDGVQVDVFVADLSAQAEVRRLASEVLQRLPRLRALVNNVGSYWNTRHVTADGFEHTFPLNYLAPCLLTDLLLNQVLRSSASDRLHRGYLLFVHRQCLRWRVGLVVRSSGEDWRARAVDDGVAALAFTTLQLG